MTDPRPTPGASACIFKDDRVLLVRRGKKGPGHGLWSLPGGHVHLGETLAQAAARELAEETGIEAEIVGLAGCRDIILRDESGAVTAHYVIAAHAGRWIAGEPAAMDDAADARWFALDELASLPLTGGAEDIVRLAREMVGPSDEPTS